MNGMNGIKRFVPTPRNTHQRFSPGWLVISLALVLALIAGCMPIQPQSAAPEAITLRFAVSDGEGHPQIDNYVHEFVDQVHTLSQGKITIEIVWDAGGGTFDGYEKGTLQRVLQGKYDLGLVASRTWDSEAITNFQALHAPFLITNNALAEAVASGAIGKRMLDSLTAVGLVGLTLWPEDLRHPFSVVPDKPLLAPQDFAGLHIRTPLSDLSYQLIDALGAMPMTGDGGYEGAESGLLQGGTLTGRPIATGNVTFYSKFQVIFANADAFNRLSVGQRTVLRQAAAATQSKAITEHPQEIDAATAYCADGGTIVLASDEQVAAFEQAAQPVFDNLAQDPLNAEMIAAIRELKASMTPSAGAAACDPTAIAPSPAPSADAQVWSEGLPPNGVWQATLTTEDLVQMGDPRSTAAEWAGVYTLTFQDGKFKNAFQGEHGESGQCQANYAVVEDVVRFTYFTNTNECVDEVDDIQWRVDADGLHLHLAAIKNSQLVENKAMLEAKPWQPVEAWSAGLPPNGTWSVELSEAELVRVGLLGATAKDYSGQQTYEFQDGEGIFRRRVNNVDVDICPFTYTAVENFVRLSFRDTGLGNYHCGNDHDDIQWRLDADGLHFHLVDTTAGKVEITAIYETKPLQKVEAWSPGLPPNGVWQNTLTTEDLVKMGDLRSTAEEWAGMRTLTFQDGKFVNLFDNGHGFSAKCQANYAVVDDFVRFTFFTDSDECPGEVDDIQWRIDEEGLHLHLVAIQNSQLLENSAMYEAKPWQKVK